MIPAKRMVSWICCMTLVMFALAGCSVVQSSNLLPNSKFAYPNSNVTAVGPTSATQSDICMILLPLPSYSSGSVMLKLAEQAARQKGGDLLIDAVVTTSVHMYLGLVSVCEVDVAGTAAKMTVGMQQLK